MRATCDRCGSLRLVRGKSGPGDRLLALLTGRRLWVCRRCGWRGRRRYTNDDLVALPHRAVDEPHPDPVVRAIDAAASGHHEPDPASRCAADLDLTAIDAGFAALASSSRGAGADAPAGKRPAPAATAPRPGVRRSSRQQRARSIALVAGALAIAAVVGLISGCRPDSPFIS